MKITLAPIPFYWPKAQVLEFYEQAKQWPVDRICLGETVCSKRSELRQEDWQTLARELQASGKEVALSTLALIEAESELKTVKSQCAQPDLLIEANDLSAVEYRFQNGLPFSGGPYLNSYNIHTLKVLNQDGMTGWTLPIELGRTDLIAILKDIESEGLTLKTEVMVHGYLPLALSARCFTARALDRPKDQCKKVCIDYPTGIPVTSQEDQRLFNLNGIQTLSGDILDLIDQVPELIQLGVDAIRISPSQPKMAAIIQAYADTIRDNSPANVPQSSAPYCNGYWYNEAGMLSV